VLRRAASPVEIILLQDKWEAKHAKNTGRLVAACITNSRIINCDKQQDALAELRLTCLEACTTALVFPLDGALLIDVGNQSEMASVSRLIFVDTTWRKATRLLETHAWLKTLPVISISGLKHSDYDIRRSSKAGGISTLEAVALVLQRAYEFKTESMHACFMEMQRHWKTFAGAKKDS